MAWYIYGGNTNPSDHTTTIRMLDINSIIREVSVGQAIELSNPQLDAIDDFHIFTLTTTPPTLSPADVLIGVRFRQSDSALITDAGQVITSAGGVSVSSVNGQAGAVDIFTPPISAAPLTSPALGGNPTVATQSPGTNNTRAASTAYSDAAVAVEAGLRTTADNLLAPKANPTFTGIATTPVIAASGLTGATAGGRFVGATASGSPVTGTFVAGDYVVDLSGKFWICTTGGSPGTWVQLGASTVTSSGTITQGNITATTTPQLMRASRGSRISITIQNLAASIQAYWGPTSGVTSSSGFQVMASGATFVDTSYSGDVYVVTASSTADLRYSEVG